MLGLDDEGAEPESLSDTVGEERLATLYWADLNLEEIQLLNARTRLRDYLILCERVTKLEFFMFSLNNPKHLRDYPNLKELSLHLQTVPRTLAVGGMLQLQRLCITECGLSSMSGIANVPSLTHLDLSQNNISRMDPKVFRSTKKLKSLWMNENRIRRIEGLEPLLQLKSLWLGRNLITSTGNSLEKSVVLEDLMLAGNQIGNFKDIPGLARLRNLVTLAFSEPHFGENPVCALCNYQTYCLFHLQQLRVLDTNMISEDARQVAEATYMKKKMYYNMRIKTLKRNTSNVIRKAMEARQTKLSQINLNLNVLLRQSKDVEREMRMRLLDLSKLTAQDPKNPGTAEELEQLHRKQKVLQEGINQKTAELERIDRMASEFRETVCQTSQTSISRLMVELETGGNIRLEDGKPSDVWYSSCVDLTQSRFVAADFAAFGISGFRVSRVTRVHHRYLRNRFEERLESMVNINDLGYKRSLEYLFFGENPNMPGELAHVMEDGFRLPEQYLQSTGHAAVPLSNSLALCDIPRLRAALDQQIGGKDGRPGHRPKDAFRTQFLITKVLLARCAQEKPFKGEERPVCAADYDGFSSVYRLVGPDSKQRRWFVFEPALVLPEYLVELEYQTTKTKMDREPSPAQLKELAGGLGAGISTEAEASDLSNLTRPLLRFVQQCALASAADPYDEICTAALNMPPPLPQREKHLKITSDVLKDQSMGKELAGLEQLNLHGHSIRKIEGLTRLTNLRVLILCFNEINKIDGLDELRKLEHLELGFNLIKRIEGIHNLSNLRVLELNNNLIYRIEDVGVLRKSVPRLEQLSLRSNAICEVKSYRSHVIRRLPSLRVLDGIMVDPDEADAALVEFSTSITPELIRTHSSLHRRFTMDVTGDGVRREQALDGAEDIEDDDNWWSGVEEIDLDHQHLRKLHNLERLTALRRASFCNNELTRIEGLEKCILLEELSLEDNRIIKLENLSTLVMLSRLDLGKNKIARVEGLDALVHLTQLSLEDNEISSLAPLAKLTSLMEIYIGNNRIGLLKEVQHMKSLPKLIILDLSGNALCQANEYRPYAIYHLRRLKVLDGVGIESTEQNSAKEKYAGRLTPDALVERLGHSFWQHVRELDLSRSKIRSLDALHADGFVNLRELNLDGNLLTDINGMPNLVGLKSLSLNHNQLVSGPPTTPNSSTRESNRRDEDIGLGALTTLEVLHLGHNQLTELTPLKLHSLQQLKVLHLQSNELQRVDGLNDLGQLRELVLDRNKIKALESTSLSSLYNLRDLRMEEVGLRSLSNFSPLPQLQTLLLGSNRVGELQEIDKLSHLQTLLYFSLHNNPIARKHLYRPTLVRKFPNLKVIDNREISDEERDRAELLLSGASDQQRQPSVHEQRMLSGKVALKLRSMNLDLMSGAPSEIALAAPTSAKGPTLGGPNAVSALAASALDSASRSGKGGDWHPMSGGHDDFFLGIPRNGVSDARRKSIRK